MLTSFTWLTIQRVDGIPSCGAGNPEGAATGARAVLSVLVVHVTVVNTVSRKCTVTTGGAGCVLRGGIPVLLVVHGTVVKTVSMISSTTSR